MKLQNPIIKRSGAITLGIVFSVIAVLGFYGLIIGIICARIYYVLFDIEAFKENPLDIFKIWEGGLAIYGGIIGGILTALVYSKIKKLNVFHVFDIGCQGLFIGQAVGRYGNFFAEGCGTEADEKGCPDHIPGSFCMSEPPPYGKADSDGTL